MYKVSLFITKNASQLNQNYKMKRYTNKTTGRGLGSMWRQGQRRKN